MVNASSEVPKVLLVHDEREPSVSLASACRERGWEVVLASDGVQALTLARKDLPDVIVLKLRLPAGGGLAVLKRIRRNVHITSIPVVGLTGGSADPGAQLMLTAGAQACVRVDAQPDQICDAIEAHIDGHIAVTEAPKDAILEPERLAALDRTGLLDIRSDEDLDALTRLAARLLCVPVAVLSLVDEDRQYFASQVGLAEPWSTTRETPLSHSFCQWVVASQESLLVEDAREHTVLKGNQAVSQLGVIAYAGVPMMAPSGERIGAFCGIDTAPRKWTERHHAILRDFVDVIAGLGVLQPTDPSAEGEAGDQPWEPADVLEVLTRGISAATRLLRTEGPRMENDEREQLLSALDRQNALLSQTIVERRAFPDPLPRDDQSAA